MGDTRETSQQSRRTPTYAGSERRARVGDIARQERRRVRSIYDRLRAHHGPADWWPGRTAFEVCVGAILTQNTAWSNVEKALRALRRERRLSYSGLRSLSTAGLAPLIRSSGYFNVKADRLRAFVDFLGKQYGGRVARMAGEKARDLREKLLRVRGIGRETADSIVLYAAGLPIFVVDAYTRRIFARLGLISGDEPYDAIQSYFMDRLPEDVGLYNDYHAQIVLLGKDICRPQRPLCVRCPLDDVCPKVGVGIHS